MTDLSTDDLQFYLELINTTLHKYQQSINEMNQSISNLLSFNKQIYEVLIGNENFASELD